MLEKSFATRNYLMLKKYRIKASFLITGSLHISAEAIRKEQRNINEEMHFLRQIKR